MTRRLTQQEQLLIGLGILVVVLLLALAIVGWITGKDFRDAKNALKTAKSEYQAAVTLRTQFDMLNARIDERKRRIAQQERGFDLSDFIGRTESELTPRFAHGDASPPQQRPLVGGKYLRTRIEFTYDKKDIESVIRFLYRIEDPARGVIISRIDLENEDPLKGDTFRMVIRLSVIEELATDE
jgi:hypothetical protein